MFWCCTGNDTRENDMELRGEISSKTKVNAGAEDYNGIRQDSEPRLPDWSTHKIKNENKLSGVSGTAVGSGIGANKDIKVHQSGSKMMEKNIENGDKMTNNSAFEEGTFKVVNNREKAI